ncbi:MAG: Nitronate monooxygenase [Sphingomonas bacterium]|nr:Nitronate monooxygenase [Sphingomonas bacterium]
MFLVSGPALVLAACAEGLVGSFPAHATRTRAEFEAWLVEIEEGLAALRAAHPDRVVAPYGVNLVTHATNPRMAGDLELCLRYRVPVVLTSKSAPIDLVPTVQSYGGVVLHDVASRRHAEKAAAAGVDGLIAVATGAGGHTGTINPFALLNEVRSVWDGPLALAGCIGTGADILAAQAMGADLAYVGTRFLATEESLASDGHKAMVAADGASDVFFSAAVDGAPANFLTRSLLAAGIELDALRTTLPGAIVAAGTAKRWKNLWSAGQGIGAVKAVEPARAVAQQLKREYAAARATLLARLSG